MSAPKDHGVPDEDDPRIFLRNTTGRLSMSGVERVVLGTVASSTICFTAGMFQEWPIAATRFRAENAHRMPRSEKGWYFYHRHKTNYAAFYAMKTGFRSAATYGPATGIVLYTEHIVDVMRGGQSKDFLSTVIAAVTVTGCYSLISTCLVNSQPLANRHRRETSDFDRIAHTEDWISVWA